MHELFAQLVAGKELQGDLCDQVRTFLASAGFPNTVLHSQQVARQAVALAERFGVDSRQAEEAAWLHDISVIYLDHRRLDVAIKLGMDLLPEEEVNPVLIHQKLSGVMASEIFKVTDPAVLSAISCHTTLKPGPSKLDLVLFVADKVAWDQPGNPPYKKEMQAALQVSLEQAALVYLRSLWERRANLPGPLHPWALGALQELQSN